MSHRERRSLLATSLVLTAVITSPALATNGLAPIGVGQEHKAMGGAAVGYAASPISMATNPAAASFVEDGMDIGVEVFRPDRSATFKGTSFGAPADMTADGNGDEMFLVPEFAYKRELKGGTSVGVAVYGNGGMNTSYDEGVPFGAAFFSGPTAASTSIDYKQIFVSPTVSHRVNDKVAVGASANIVYQRFEAEGLGAFGGFSSDAANLTNRGSASASGVGATLGVQAQLTDKLSAGLSYRSKVDMDKMDKYAGLFPNGGEFDVPAATTLGVSYQATPQTVIAADVQKIEYSGVDAIGNSTATPSAFGSDGGPGFGWEDQTVFKVGVKHQVSNDLAVMAGYNRADSPIDGTETTLNALAPAVVEEHISVGLEKKLTPKSSVIATYRHALENTITGNATVPPPGPLPLDAYDLTMKQDAVGVAYRLDF